MELFARLGRITVVESMVNEAAAYVAEREWRERYLDSPHGQTWFTSMHVSSFPGDDSRACPRALAYEMMAFAQTEAMPQKVPAAGAVGVGDRGLAGLHARLRRARALGSPRRRAPDRARGRRPLADRSPDLVVLPPFWNRPLVSRSRARSSSA
jgi:hypothetical protein